jgi:hydrogenase maturation protease
MNLTLVDRIAGAVLYEGYLLYPYRASAIKNRQRWNFGAVCPDAFSKASRGTDASVMQTECLVIGSKQTQLDVKVRFLHLLAREVGVLASNDLRAADRPDEDFRIVEALEVNGKLLQTWQEAVEREVSTGTVTVGDLLDNSTRVPFSFAATHVKEPIFDDDGELAGMVVRRHESIVGALDLSADQLRSELYKITARITNLCSMTADELQTRDQALMKSTVSTHTILAVREGEFVSLLDPPADLRDQVSHCVNTGTYPVLIGAEGERDLMLSSPIILYDYPQLAPESAGELFDSTEIDEILTLRIMTLTDDEKREMRDVDDRARQILERTENMPVEQLMKLHGAVRGLRPVDKESRS